MYESYFRVHFWLSSHLLYSWSSSWATMSWAFSWFLSCRTSFSSCMVKRGLLGSVRSTTSWLGPALCFDDRQEKHLLTSTYQRLNSTWRLADCAHSPCPGRRSPPWWSWPVHSSSCPAPFSAPPETSCTCWPKSRTFPKRALFWTVNPTLPRPCCLSSTNLARLHTKYHKHLLPWAQTRPCRKPEQATTLHQTPWRNDTTPKKPRKSQLFPTSYCFKYYKNSVLLLFVFGSTLTGRRWPTSSGAALPPSLIHQWRDSVASRGGQSILATGEYKDRIRLKMIPSTLSIAGLFYGAESK